MEFRKLGTSDLKVASIGLGTMNFGWLCDEKESFRILDEYVGKGGNFLDTANIYSKGKKDGFPHERGLSEQIIGSWINERKCREKVLIATKVRGDMGDGFTGLSKRSIKFQVEQSLKRLRTDCIDLYQAHSPDPDVAISETMEAFDQLIKEGKVRYAGCSNYCNNEIEEAISCSKDANITSYIANQVGYHFFVREDVERDILLSTRKHNLGVIIFKALGGGFFTGKYREGKPIPDSPSAEVILKRAYNKKGWAFIGKFDELAKKYDATVIQVVLSWYLKNPNIQCTLVGSRNIEQIREIMGAVKVDLNETDYQSVLSI